MTCYEYKRHGECCGTPLCFCMSVLPLTTQHRARNGIRVSFSSSFFSLDDQIQTESTSQRITNKSQPTICPPPASMVSAYWSCYLNKSGRAVVNIVSMIFTVLHIEWLPRGLILNTIVCLEWCISAFHKMQAVKCIKASSSTIKTKGIFTNKPAYKWAMLPSRLYTKTTLRWKKILPKDYRART